jgi:hypothetical protein
MLHFFRKIRRDLIANSQFFKYLKYAIGEIVLVVLGILIALYINNWNRTRLDIRYEKIMLSEIQKDLQRQVKDLNSYYEFTVERTKTISVLDSLLKEKPHVYNKSLDTLFGAVWGIHGVGLFDKSKYDNLKSRGLNVIQVDSIKEQLTLIYEIFYASNQNLNDLEYKFNETVTRPYYLKNFINLQFRTSATPVDFESVWMDHEYHNLVSLRLSSLRGNQIKGYQDLIQGMEDLEKMIANYLDQEN